MVFVIGNRCCKDASCVAVCPVDCIRPRPSDEDFDLVDHLYIDPAACIGCSACMYACPAAAIVEEIDTTSVPLMEAVDDAREFFSSRPTEPRFEEYSFERTTVNDRNVRVAVVGAGPSAMYAVAELLEAGCIEVTLFDRLPTPFGLARSGVAPDHPETKLMAEYFQTLLEDPRVHGAFNVEIGTHLSVEDLRRHFHAVIYAGGAGEERALGLEGETLAGVLSAREVVSWYNGHPDFADLDIDVGGTSAIIIGNGNVALDVARILVGEPARLASTDIADHALEVLRRSSIRDVIVVGRRESASAACTPSELAELRRLPNVNVQTLMSEVNTPTSADLSWRQGKIAKAFREIATSGLETHRGRRALFRFGLRPTRILGAERVEAVEFIRTGSLEVREVIDAALVVKAAGNGVGFISGLPRDESSGTVANDAGRVVTPETGTPIAGLYCVGWAKRGPTGVIGTNRVCAQETVGSLLHDLATGRLQEPSKSLRSFEGLLRLRYPQQVTKEGWGRIDAVERERGRSAPLIRPRIKIARTAEMLDVVRSYESVQPMNLER